MRPGLLSAKLSAPSPMRSSAPGRKFSITTSAPSISRRAAIMPSGPFRSRHMLRLLRLHIRQPPPPQPPTHPRRSPPPPPHPTQPPPPSPPPPPPTPPPTTPLTPPPHNPPPPPPPHTPP